MKFSSPSGNLAQTAVKALLLLGITAPLASAKVVNYRYVRFHPTATKTVGGLPVSLSEFQFFNGSTRIPTLGATVTDPGPGASTSSLPGMAYDNYLNSTWQNTSYFSAYLTFDFGASKTIDSYNFTTNGFTIGEDPVSWTVEGSTNGSDWVPLDSITRFATPDGRYQAASTTNFVFPNAAKPQITAFEYSDLTQPFIVANGTDFPLYYETSNATSVKITAENGSNVATLYSKTGNVDSDFPTITPLPDKQGTYTLTATNSAGSTTRSLVIRAASPHVQSYRYVRYTPLKLRTGLTAIQLANFDFSLAGNRVPVASVTNPGGTTGTVGEGVANLLDQNTATKWYTTNLSPVIFDFGVKTDFDSYSFATANDHSERDPIQWTIEGSNDSTAWTLLENVTTPSYTTTVFRLTDSGRIPFAGASVPAIATLTSSAPFVAAGDPVTLTYSASGSSTVTISPGNALTDKSGTVTVTPTATTTYTLTSTTAGGNTATASVTINVVTPTGSVNFTNFDSATDLSLVAGAQLVNDFATFPNSPNAKRIRLTDLRPNQYGAAWSASKIKVTDGFETTFNAQISHPNYVNTVGGIGFIIQNSATSYNSANQYVRYLANNAVSVTLETFTGRDLSGKLNTADESEANVKVYVGSTLKNTYNIDSKGLKYARGYHGNYFVTKPTATPYKVRIAYASGKLSVYIDDKAVVENLAIDLSTAVDANGRAYLGFDATSGYAGAYQDIVDWSVTPAAAATTPLLITASSFTLGNPAQAVLTFSSTSGKTYQITQSTDLLSWAPIGSPVTATSTSTTTTVPFTAGDKGFFRVEQTN